MNTYFAPALVTRGAINGRTLGDFTVTLEASGKQAAETAGETSESPDTLNSDPT
jgi:hypothetical protein